MALSVESANLVRQRAVNAVENASPYVQEALKAFFRWWATHKGNNDLQFLAIDPTTAITGDGQDFGVDAAHQVYFVYVRKTGTDGVGNATDSYLQVIDDADNDSELRADVRITAGLLEAGDTFVAAYPDGLPMAEGIVVTFSTTPAGAQAGDSDVYTQSAAADAGPGFIIIGA